MQGLTEILFASFGPTEWIWIVLIVVVLLFGAKKIPEIARSIGRASGEIQRGKIEVEKELQKAKQEAQAAVAETPASVSEREKLEKIATDLGLATAGKTDEQLREEIGKALQK